LPAQKSLGGGGGVGILEQGNKLAVELPLEGGIRKRVANEFLNLDQNGRATSENILLQLGPAADCRVCLRGRWHARMWTRRPPIPASAIENDLSRYEIGGKGLGDPEATFGLHVQIRCIGTGGGVDLGHAKHERAGVSLDGGRT
jgi:hypothetical protein